MPRGRPQFKPTAAQRNRVRVLKADNWSQERIARLLGIDADTLAKHFAEELSHGADIKLAEVLDHADRGVRKGNASLIKWVTERRLIARAAREMEERANGPTEAEPKLEKLGKKEQRQRDAGAVSGKFAPPAGPSKAVH